MVAGLGSAGVSLAGGAVITTLGYRSYFLLDMAAVVMGAVVFWGWRRGVEGRR
jgi:hypothetical protein